MVINFDIANSASTTAKWLSILNYSTHWINFQHYLKGDQLPLVIFINKYKAGRCHHNYSKRHFLNKRLTWGIKVGNLQVVLHIITTRSMMYKQFWRVVKWSVCLSYLLSKIPEIKSCRILIPEKLLRSLQIGWEFWCVVHINFFIQKQRFPI